MSGSGQGYQQPLIVTQVQSQCPPNQFYAYLATLDPTSFWYRNYFGLAPKGLIRTDHQQVQLTGEFFQGLTSNLLLDPNLTPQEKIKALIEKSMPPPQEMPDPPQSLGKPGFYGYLSYDFHSITSKRNNEAPQHLAFPEACLGFYPLVITHLEGSYYFCYFPSPEQNSWAAKLCTFLKSATQSNQAATGFKLQTKMQSNMDFKTYEKAFKQIQQHLLLGDVYQVNLAQRFCAQYQGDPLQAHLILGPLYPAPYSAFMRFPWADISSHSPELFLSVISQEIITKPIKGTAPRQKNHQQDQIEAQNLLQSVKNQAENLMIVDLLRNDLGRSCEAGSIEVDKLYDLESYANVHHLVSTIRGKLRPQTSALDAFFNAFPGGSITGAPKKRAIEIIDQLEPHARMSYCGSLGFLDMNQRLDMNINIRSLVFMKNKDQNTNLLYLWGGGGIVADSECESEYKESITKVSPLIQGLESLA